MNLLARGTHGCLLDRGLNIYRSFSFWIQLLYQLPVWERRFLSSCHEEVSPCPLGVTPLFGPYGDVPLNRVSGFSEPHCLEQGIQFTPRCPLNRVRTFPKKRMTLRPERRCRRYSRRFRHPYTQTCFKQPPTPGSLWEVKLQDFFRTQHCDGLPLRATKAQWRTRLQLASSLTRFPCIVWISYVDDHPVRFMLYFEIVYTRFHSPITNEGNWVAH